MILKNIFFEKIVAIFNKRYNIDLIRANCPICIFTLQEKNSILYEFVNKMFNHIKNDVLVSINIGITVNLKMEQILPFAFQIMFPDLGNPNNDPRWEQRVHFSEYKTKLLTIDLYWAGVDIPVANITNG